MQGHFMHALKDVKLITHNERVDVTQDGRRWLKVRDNQQSDFVFFVLDIKQDFPRQDSQPVTARTS